MATRFLPNQPSKRAYYRWKLVRVNGGQKARKSGGKRRFRQGWLEKYYPPQPAKTRKNA